MGKGKNIAYVRVSSIDQNEARQKEALQPYNIDKWFIEKASGKDTQRPKLQEMLEYIREDDTVYVERETITNEQFPAMMKAAKALPKTSQPPIGKFVEAFDRLGADGSEVLCVTMMASISGTVHAAEQAAQMTKTKVTVVDCQSTDRGMAFQILAAAKLIEAGGIMMPGNPIKISGCADPHVMPGAATLDQHGEQIRQEFSS